MSKRKKFLLKLLIVVAGIAIADKSAGVLMHYFYFRIHHGEQGRITYAIDSARQPLIVLGSSRASHHYVPALITDSLAIACYNAGKDKQGIFYSLAILKAICARYRPAGIILDLTPVSFETKESSLDELSVLLPYYRQHNEIQDIVNKRSRWEWFKTRSLLYCYNSLPLQILFNNISDEREADAESGYVPLYKIWKPYPGGKTDTAQKANFADSILINAFKEIIAITKQQQATLVVVVSPGYQGGAATTQTVQVAKEICAGEKVWFFDYSESAAFINNTALFGDQQHLNNAGAVLFTHLLCNDLKPVFSKKGHSEAESH